MRICVALLLGDRRHICIRMCVCTLVGFLAPCDSVGYPPNQVVEVLATIPCTLELKFCSWSSFCVWFASPNAPLSTRDTF